MEKLTTPAVTFKGIIEGEFSDKSLPADMQLVVKEGAQIMFIKNDTGEERKYYNGKIAVIKSIHKDTITVTMRDEGVDFELKKETWQNIRYQFNKDKNAIVEDIIGKYTQYPIRLAWAITIHKSQGLTFDKVVIDAGQSFAAGQVYVALSRCTTLDGMVLLSRIFSTAIGTDPRIIAFAEKEMQEDRLEHIISTEKVRYQQKKLFDAFNWDKPVKQLEAFAEFVPDRTLENKRGAILLTTRLLQAIYEQREVAEKFREKLPALIADFDINKSNELHERVTKAIDWFGDTMQQRIFAPLVDHLHEINGQGKIKKYYEYVLELITTLEMHLKNIFEVRYGEINLYRGANSFKQYVPNLPTKTAGKIKAPKGNTFLESLQLYQDGLSVDEIALARSLSYGTILKHLLQFVESGETTIEGIIPSEKINKIKAIARELDTTDLTLVRGALGKGFDYAEVKIVLGMMMDEV